MLDKFISEMEISENDIDGAGTSDKDDEMFFLVDEELVEKAIMESQLDSVLIMTITIIIGSSIFYLVISSVMKPLKILTEKAEKIDVDNIYSLKNEIATDEGGYEIVELSKSFDKAIGKIYSSYEKQRNFSSNVAHELKTPIAVLQAKIDIYKTKHDDDPELDEFINTIETNVTRLSELIDGILFLSRDGELFISEVYVKDMIEEIIFDLEEISEKKNISVEVKGVNPILFTDDVLLNRMLFNVIENAIKYNVDDGKVEIEIKENETEVEIDIKDTGIGIKDEDKKNIFDLFYRVDESRNRKSGGYGIGLSLALNISNRLGGAIEVLDNTPQGTIFKLKIKK